MVQHCRGVFSAQRMRFAACAFISDCTSILTNEAACSSYLENLEALRCLKACVLAMFERVQAGRCVLRKAGKVLILGRPAARKKDNICRSHWVEPGFESGF